MPTLRRATNKGNPATRFQPNPIRLLSDGPFALARRLLPDSAIARIEEVNGLVMLFGKARLAEAEKLYKEAARCAPADAMQKLDAQHAREEADG